MMKVLEDGDQPIQFSLGTALALMLFVSLALGLNIHPMGLVTVVADVILLDLLALLSVRLSKNSPSAMLALFSVLLIQFALTATTLLALGGLMWGFFALFG